MDMRATHVVRRLPNVIPTEVAATHTGYSNHFTRDVTEESNRLPNYPPAPQKPAGIEKSDSVFSFPVHLYIMKFTISNVYTSSDSTEACTSGWSVSLTESGNLNTRQVGSYRILTGGVLVGPLFETKALETGNLQELAEAADRSNGSYALLIIRHDDVVIVTDASGSIPVYYGVGNKGVAVGSQVHEVAYNTGLTEIDPVSVTDYLLYETICYPYSWYTNVNLVPPVSVFRVSKIGETETLNYYTPEEPDFVSVPDQKVRKEWGRVLHDEANQAVLAGIEGYYNSRILFSGGEDSRAILGLVPLDFPCTPTTVLDERNLEYRIAEKAAKYQKRKLEWIQRPQKFYRRDIQGRIQSIGPGWTFLQTHIYGDVATPLKDSDVIFGGYLADALFKTDQLVNYERNSGAPNILNPPNPEKIRAFNAKQVKKTETYLDADLVASVKERRLNHHEVIKSFRPTTAGNWQWLWPLSNMYTYPHHLSNLRLGPKIIEPFFWSNVYKLGARMPDIYKVNSDAFYSAFSKSMGRSGWLTTSGGFVPRLGSGRSNYVYKAIIHRLRERQKKKSNYNDGPWSRDSGGWQPKPLNRYLTEGQVDTFKNNMGHLLNDPHLELLNKKQIPRGVKARSLALAFEAEDLIEERQT